MIMSTVCPALGMSEDNFFLTKINTVEPQIFISSAFKRNFSDY